jgi:EAL domain-containing protein (putative c-di-GMP-specific phosphodiesterase class I)
VVAGYAGFHSHFCPKVLAAAEEHGVDPARLVIELCEIDRFKVGDADLERVASRLRETADDRVPHAGHVPG